MIKEIVEAVSIPVMAKVRIGHLVEAQVNVSSDNKRHSNAQLRDHPPSKRRYYKALESTTSTSQRC